jgi:hypothetical protein
VSHRHFILIIQRRRAEVAVLRFLVEDAGATVGLMLFPASDLTGTLATS